MTQDEANKELKRLLNEYKNLVGRDYKKIINPNDLKETLDAIKLLNGGIQNFKNAAENIGDEFESIFSTFTDLRKESLSFERILKSQIAPNLKLLEKSTLKIKDIHANILDGYINEKEILREIRKIKQSTSSIDAVSNYNNKADAIEQAKALENVGNELLKIAQHSKTVSENWDSFAETLEEIPLLGKVISKPFSDIGKEINKNITKTQLLKLNLEAATNEISILEKQIKSHANFNPNQSIEDQEKRILGIKGIDPLLKKNLEKWILMKQMSAEYNTQLGLIPSNITIITDRLKLFFSRMSLITGALALLFKGIKLLGNTVKDIFVQIDLHVTELARSFAISREEATKLVQHYNDLATSANHAYIAQKDLYQTQIAYNKELGITVELSDENLSSLSKAREFTKLSENAMSGLQHIMTQTGKSADEIQNSILGTSAALQIQNGILLDQKQILEDVLSTSASIRSQFHNNVEEISKAVTQAKILGFNLKDLEAIQGNLLSFESSIGAEIDAEILLNRELYLDKARYYALHGDLNNLQKEINENLIKSGEYDRLNIIQKEAVAKALGLSQERLAEIAITQKEINKTQAIFSQNKQLEKFLLDKNLTYNKEGLATAVANGVLQKEQLNSLGEAVKRDISRLSTAQKLEKTTERFRDIMATIMDDVIGPALNGINKLLDYLNKSSLGGFITKVAVGGIGVAMIGGIIAAIIRLSTMGTAWNPLYVISTGLGGNPLGTTPGAGVGGNIRGALGNRWLKVGGALTGGLMGIGEYMNSKDAGLSTIASIGRGILSGVGGGLGAWGGSAMGAALGTALLPGIGTIIGGLLGGGIGAYGGGTLGKGVANSIIPIPQHAEGGITTRAHHAIVGEKGPEAIVPLTEFNSKLDKLISAIESKQNLYFDGRLVGDAIALRSFK